MEYLTDGHKATQVMNVIEPDAFMKKTATKKPRFSKSRAYVTTKKIL